MNRYNNFTVLLIMITLITAAIPSAVLSQQIDAKWDFVVPGDTMGWTANSDIGGFKQTAGFLYGEAKGVTPQVTSPEFTLAASNEQIIQIVMLSDKEGSVKVNWANTKEEPNSGFRPEKVLEFKVAGDKKLHAYELLPFWQNDGQVIKLRIDPPSGSTFRIDYIRILRLPMRVAEPQPVWDFFGGPGSWFGLRGIETHTPREGSWAMTAEADSMILSPSMSLGTKSNQWITVVMKASAGSKASLLWVTDKNIGANTTEFPIITDGRMHTYNIEMKSDKNWQGNLVRLGLKPADKDAEVLLKMMAVAPVRQGPAEIVVKDFKATPAEAATGREIKVTAVLLNNGGEAAKDLNVVLNMPKNVELKSGQLAQAVKEMASGAQNTLEWVVSAKDAGEYPLDLEVSGNNIPTAKDSVKAKWSQAAK